jgi:hypothetical protein
VHTAFAPLRPGRIAAGILALLALAPAGAAQGLDQDLGIWTAFAGQGSLRSGGEKTRWRWWFDAHARFQHQSDGFEQSIVRPGLGYDLSPEATAWLGYAWIVTDPEAGGSFDEHRVWQQLTWGRTIDAGAVFSRTRLEQRWLETGDDVGWRLRQFLRLARPVSEGSHLAWRFWDEGFFDLNDTDWGAHSGFAQNRLFAGLGWTFEDAEHLTLEFGYLNQLIYRRSADDSMNHVLALTLLVSL